MSILDQIANPQMADIVGALDVRQQRLDKDEAKRKEIRMGQLIAEALPGLKEGTAIHEMATLNPNGFAAFAKAIGLPLNAGERMQEFANDTEMLYTLAQDDPRAAMEYAMEASEERKAAGRDSSQMDRFIAGMREDPMRTMTGLFSVHRSLTGAGGMSESDKLAREKFEWEKSQGPKATEGTSNQKDWAEYQRLLKDDPESAEAFGRAAGFVTQEGQDLSAFAEKQLAEASDEFSTASAASGRYVNLANNLRKSAASGGLKSTWTEYLKEQTGNQDEITALKKEAQSISNSEAIKNLPPGPATDRDIQIVMAPFPTEKANPEYVSNWLEAMSRLNQKRAQYAEFKADFIAEHGSLRDNKGNSLASAWKTMQKQTEQGGSGEGAMTPGIAPASVTGETAAQRFARLKGGN